MSTSYYQGCIISLTELGGQYVSKIYENGNTGRALSDSPKSPVALGEAAAITAAQEFIDARYKKDGTRPPVQV
jgi:hypothetical protein